MRVYHLIKGLGRGGAEMLLADAQRCAGGDPTFAFAYLLPWKDALVGDIEAAGGRVVCLRAGSLPALPWAVLAMARELRRWRADLLHCHLPLSGVVGRLAGRLAGVPVVYTEHNLQERYHPWTRRANLATWRLQREVVAVSAEVAASIQRHAGGRVPVRVLANGIRVESFRRDAEAGRRLRGELGIAADAPVVGTVAVFRVQKRLDRWLAAAAELHRRLPAARFLLVGDGPLRGEVEAVASATGLGDAVVWGGLQTDVLPWLSAMDVYLMSSDFEGLPLALLEAMAAELAVVSTPVGGIPEVVVDGESGLLAAPEPAALAAAAGALLADRGRRLELGRAAHRRVEERFSSERMQAQLRDLYRRVLDRGRGAETTP